MFRKGASAIHRDRLRHATTAQGSLRRLHPGTGIQPVGKDGKVVSAPSNLGFNGRLGVRLIPCKEPSGPRASWYIPRPVLTLYGRFTHRAPVKSLANLKVHGPLTQNVKMCVSIKRNTNRDRPICGH